MRTEARGLSEDLTCVVEEVELRRPPRGAWLSMPECGSSPGLPRSARSCPVRGLPCSRPPPSFRLQSVMPRFLHAVLGQEVAKVLELAYCWRTGKALTKLPAVVIMLCLAADDFACCASFGVFASALICSSGPGMVEVE